MLASQGRPVAIASNLSADELQAIAELVRVDGTLVAGIREKFTRWYAGYLTARKATEATEA